MTEPSSSVPPPDEPPLPLAPFPPEEDRRTCWKCRRSFPRKIKLCVYCGVDLETGRELSDSARVAEESREERGPRGLAQLAAFYFPGLFSPAVLLGSLALGIIAAVVGLAALAILGWGLVLAAVMVGAGAMVVYAQALVWLMAGRFCVLNDGMVDFRGEHWSLLALLLVAPLAGLLILAKFSGL